MPLLPKAVVATAAFAGLHCGELGGLEWTDYSGDALNVKRSVWRTIVNQPKTRASAKPVPVIRQLAEILDAYRSSMGNPQSGVMFHSGAGQHMKKLEATVDLVNQSAPRVPNLVGQCGKMLKSNRGEVAERLNAAVC